MMPSASSMMRGVQHQNRWEWVLEGWVERTVRGLAKAGSSDLPLILKSSSGKFLVMLALGAVDLDLNLKILQSPILDLVLPKR